ncbi:MAG: tetratricopeptide repeat protein [Bacteroidota bacterium]|nr:tetratricopeptide repeat protein [Bacteroidota bacterium]
MNNKLVILFFVFLQTLQLHAQKIETFIKAGNDLYKEQQYEQAEAQYRKALEIDPDNRTAQFNLANTLYKLNMPDEAKAIYDQITKNEKEVTARSGTFYNKGVVLSSEKKLEESIEAYKDALRLNPDDKEARENLQKALLELKKKNPPKKEDEKKKQQNEQKQQQKPQSKMSQKEAEQKLKLLEQKEKEAQQRLQKEKAKGGVSQPKDW